MCDGLRLVKMVWFVSVPRWVICLPGQSQTGSQDQKLRWPPEGGSLEATEIQRAGEGTAVRQLLSQMNQKRRGRCDYRCCCRVALGQTSSVRRANRLFVSQSELMMGEEVSMYVRETEGRQRDCMSRCVRACKQVVKVG